MNKMKPLTEEEYKTLKEALKSNKASSLHKIIKIKDLTIQDIKNICKGTKLKECHKGICPLYNYQWLCLGLRNMTKKELEEEVLL